jgi:hypothetical protein
VIDRLGLTTQPSLDFCVGHSRGILVAHEEYTRRVRVWLENEFVG